jgi:hypothetical protein
MSLNETREQHQSLKARRTLFSAMATPSDPYVVLHTSAGEIGCELYWDHAPKTCRNFYELAKRGYYDGCKVLEGLPAITIGLFLTRFTVGRCRYHPLDSSVHEPGPPNNSWWAPSR